MSYFARRLIRAILLLIGVSILCFLFTEMAPGNFFDEMRLNPQISPETIQTLQSRYGLDQTLLVRYARWVKSAMHADFGYSIAYNEPVASLLWSRAKNTLLLTATATFFAWLISVPLGTLAAAQRGKLLDKATTIASSILISIPEIVITIALLAIVVRWRLLHVGGMMSADLGDVSLWAKIQDVMMHMALPALILALLEGAVVVRHVRASVLDVLEAPYIQATKGLGISKARILFRHVLPVAANPAISLFGLSLAGLIGGSLLVEVVTGWPGMGPLILEATLSRDFYLVIGGIMFSAVFMVGGNLIADLMLMASDPRIRTGGESAL